jgi:phosphoglycolate phosphatase
MWAGNQREPREIKIKRYKAVVFDLDGTLIDSKKDILGAFHSAFDSLGKERPSDDALMHTIGYRLEECFYPFLEKNEELCSKAAIAFREYYKDHYLDQTIPYDGIDDSLKKLSLDVPLGLATMKKGYYARKILHAFGWDSLFKSVSASEEGLKSKPDPEMLFKVISDLGVKPEETLYIGDTSIDLEMATRAKVPFLFADWGYGSLDGQANGVETAHAPLDLQKYLE